MKKLTNKLPNLRLLGLVLCGLVLSGCSQELEVFTGPFLIRDGITYDQNTDEPITGIVEEFYSDGQLRERMTYRDGEIDGLSEVFFEGGQIEIRTNHIDGKVDGLVELFDEDGNLIRTQLWKNGLRVIAGDKLENRDGLTYHLLTDQTFTGIGEYRYTDGQLSSRITYRQGIRDGIQEEFDPDDGDLWYRWTYENGELVFSEIFDDNGLLEFTVRDVYENSYVERFDEDGNLTKTETYRNGINGELIEENNNP